MKKIKTTAQQGFTLIELMIVVAIIGILAAVAVPYQEYVANAHGGAAMKGVQNYISKAQACVQTGIGCATLQADGGAVADLTVGALINKNIGGTVTWNDGDCSVTATLDNAGGAVYAAASTGAGATAAQCNSGAGL